MADTNAIISDKDYLLTRQYKDADNLKARIALHERFGKPGQPFHAWLFEHIQAPVDARVLELGAGSGLFWRINKDRIPATWAITLSDLSEGMLAEAKHTATAAGIAATYHQLDAQAIPFAEATFDLLLANHMIYHIPDKAEAIREMRRVLKPEGRLYAATNGREHLQELKEMMLELFAKKLPGNAVTLPEIREFTLEDGAEMLGASFETVKLYPQQDELVVTEAEPLMAYMMSMIGWRFLTSEADTALLEQVIAEARADLDTRLSRAPIHIRRVTGLFEAY